MSRLVDLGGQHAGFLSLPMNSTVDRHGLALAQVSEGVRDLGGGDLAKARQAFEQAIELAPDLAVTHYNLAVAHLRLGDKAGAERAARQTLEIDPAHPGAAHMLGAILVEADRTEEAFGWLELAAQGAPDNVQMQRDLGVAQLFLGDLERARATLMAVAEADPTVSEVLPTLVELMADRRNPAETRWMAACLDRAAAASETADPATRATIHISHFKWYEARGDYDLAFDHAQKACALRRQAVDPHFPAFERLLEKGRAAFTRERIEALAPGGAADGRPIFILGLPRSGTTLVEQILCAHPRVFGAGETMTLLTLLNQCAGPDGSRYPDWCAGMNRSDAKTIGETYLARLPPAPVGCARTTDKRLENVFNVGLIASALPNATLIHCRRDPRDMALSSFTTLFSGGQEWSYDLGEIVRYARLHEAMMAHWREVLPGRILEVEYEQVVANLESEARRIVGHSGLDWDDRCLQFHEARRAVRSASVVQVRRPIYDRSIGRWKPYAHRLGPVVEAFGSA